MSERAGVACRMAVAVCLLAAVTRPGVADEKPTERTYRCRDSLQPTQDAIEDAQDLLEHLSWEPGEFTVTCSVPAGVGALLHVRFPSPVASGDEKNDAVHLQWYPVYGADGQLQKAPAVIVVHESGPSMIAGRLFARALQAEKVHAFLIHLPGYGERRTAEKKPSSLQAVLLMRQAIADVRRARDAVAILPSVEAQQVGVQGTSLGGFVAALSASLDHAFSFTFIMLAGGDLYDLIQNGEKDTARVREMLARNGYEGTRLQQFLWQAEPTRLAHRLAAESTWLYSAQDDRVVPMRNALALASAARLDARHHIIVGGTHYSAILAFPTIVEHMVQQIRQR